VASLETSGYNLIYGVTNVVKRCILNYLFGVYWKMIYRRIFLFCKPTDGGATSLEVFNLICHKLRELQCMMQSTMYWWSPLICGWNARLQALVRKKAPHIIQKHCMFHRQALAPRNMSEELQTVLQALIRIVNYVKNSPQSAHTLPWNMLHLSHQSFSKDIWIRRTNSHLSKWY
jgi:hypothetical protein